MCVCLYYATGLMIKRQQKAVKAHSAKKSEEMEVKRSEKGEKGEEKSLDKATGHGEGAAGKSHQAGSEAIKGAIQSWKDLAPDRGVILSG